MTDRAVDVVLFDADGVVQLTSPRFIDELAALAGDVSAREAFLTDVFAAEKPCATGAAEFGPRLAGVLEQWGSSASLSDALAIWTLINPVTAVLDLVERVRASGLTVGLATNQQAYRASYMSRTLDYGSRFDHEFYSCEVGHAKPDTLYFDAVIARLGTAPSRVLFIDDHEGNVAAAQSAGLIAARFHADEGVEALHNLLAANGVSC